ncbi:hypothetical protein GIB67_029509, partial [Kingdonia uniflora]
MASFVLVFLLFLLFGSSYAQLSSTFYVTLSTTVIHPSIHPSIVCICHCYLYPQSVVYTFCIY